MHCELRQADVNGGEGHLGGGDRAEGGATGDICAVIIVLEGYVFLRADGAENGFRDTVCGIALVAVMLDNYSAAKEGGVFLIGKLGMVGVEGVGIICADHKAIFKHCIILLFCACDPLQGIVENAGGCALLGFGAYLFVIEDCENLYGILVYGRLKESAERCVNALEVIKTGRNDELICNAAYSALISVIYEEIVGDNIGGRNGEGFCEGRFDATVISAKEGDEINGGIVLCAVIYASVKVNCYGRDDHCILIEVYKTLFDTVFCRQYHSACYGERTVKPGIVDHSTVLLYGESIISGVDLVAVLHSE